MKTLKLFNAVVEKKSKTKKPFVSEDGYLIESGALYAKDRIVEYFQKEALNGNDLNKTFHKSWQKIKNSDRGELLIEQILHYLSTYGTDYQGEVYVPDEVLKVPGVKIAFKVIKAYTKQTLIEKALNLLRSGAALKEETVNDLITVLVDELGYRFTGDEGIKNKEAVVKIADLYGVIPNDFLGFFRYILYRATGSTLVIKDGKTIATIKATKYNPSAQFHRFGLEKLAENFNRFKPLFLAFKGQCPKTINTISRLSKALHKPMVQNPLNLVTSRRLTPADNHWLDNATPYALFKALSALWNRINGQTTFLHKIRNGKSYARQGASSSAADYNYQIILNHIRVRFPLTGKKIFIPEDVNFALPTSEKLYVGNIPMGTKFYGNSLAVGIYWENAWGARDLDLSSINVEGKVGWNRSYNQNEGGVLFSGDMTDATNGAVEYLRVQGSKTVLTPTLVLVNVFNGEDDSKFNIIVGRGDKITKDFMMNPNNLFLFEKTQAVQKQSIIGLFLREGKREAFVLLTLGAGSARVSGYDEHSTLARKALVQEYSNPLSFNDLVVALGSEIVKDAKKADVDLSLNKLERDSFIKLFQ